MHVPTELAGGSRGVLGEISAREEGASVDDPGDDRTPRPTSEVPAVPEWDSLERHQRPLPFPWDYDTPTDETDDTTEWRTVEASDPRSALARMFAPGIDFPRLTYNSRYAMGPMAVGHGQWRDAEVRNTRVLLDQVERVTVHRGALRHGVTSPVSGDAIVLELVNGDWCAPLALIDDRRNVTDAWVFLDTLFELEIPVDDDVGDLLDDSTRDDERAETFRWPATAGDPALGHPTLFGGSEPVGVLDWQAPLSDEDAVGASPWSHVLAQPLVTEPAGVLPDAMPAEPAEPPAEHWEWVTGRDSGGLFRRITGHADRFPRLLYNSRLAVGRMVLCTGDWSRATVSSFEVDLDDVERITVHHRALHRVDARSSTGDTELASSSKTGDAIVLDLGNGELFAPLALVDERRDDDGARAFLTAMVELAIPVDPGVWTVLDES